MFAKDDKIVARIMASFQLQKPRLNTFKNASATYDNNLMQIRY